MRRKNKQGQVLLIIIMLLATSLTVLLSTSFTTTTNTQTAKLEEESQKALAVAEAGIETALKQGAVSDISTLAGGVGTGYTGNTTVNTTYDKTTFISPLLQKDEQYTFYLSDYPSLGASSTDSLTIYYGSGEVACSDIALEMTVIYGSSPSYSIKRYIADRGNRLSSNTGDIDDAGFTGGTLEDVGFNCSTSSDSIDLNTLTNAKVLIIRSLFSGTKIGVKSTATLKSQGTIITSTAKNTNIGASKKVQLFQSFPQLPTDFFVTSF